MSNKKHWEKIYTTKSPSEVSWTQEVPEVSLELIAKFKLPLFAKIIDVGGGDSLLVDHLLELGYTNLTVLDISEAAIDRAKERLGENAAKVKWVVSDILEFNPSESYDLWHDRAVFHFLTEQVEVDRYLHRLTKMGTRHLVVGTFSLSGPLKCSGLHVTQYDEAKIKNVFCPPFELVECITRNHTTPFDTIQNFTFARLTV